MFCSVGLKFNNLLFDLLQRNKVNEHRSFSNNQFGKINMEIVSIMGGKSSDCIVPNLSTNSEPQLS